MMSSVLRVLVLALIAFGAMVIAEEPAEARVSVATHAQLNSPTALLNKNTAVTDTNAAILRSNVIATQNDKLNLEAEPAEAGPRDIQLTGERDVLPVPKSEHESELIFRGGFGHLGHGHFGHGFFGFRHRFFHPFFRGGYYGWRYPLGYWNLYGPRFFGICPYGRIFGGFYYC